MYYLIKAIISLEKEIKEIKNKCIQCNNNSNLNFNISELTTTENFYSGILKILNKIQNSI
jgi:hypothetical protein